MGVQRLRLWWRPEGVARACSVTLAVSDCVFIAHLKGIVI